jgi:hypothetical protein
LTTTLQDAARRLDTDSVTGLHRVVTVAEAEHVLSGMIGRDEPCGPESGLFMARNLIGLYPAREVGDAKAYAAGMTALLAAHPIDFVRRVCDPVRGLPSRLKWLPTLADVNEAIEAERKRRDRIAANARHVIAEAERAKAKAEQEAELQASRGSEEDRAQQVREAMACLKTVPITEPPAPKRDGWKPSKELLDDLARRKAARDAEQIANAAPQESAA